MGWDDEMDSLADDVEEAFGVAVTVRRVTPGAMNTSTMVRTKVTSDTAVDAMRGRSRTQDAGSGRVEQVRYTIKAARLAFRPDAGDQLIDGTLTYTVTGCEYSVDQRCYELDVERGLTSP